MPLDLSIARWFAIGLAFICHERNILRLRTLWARKIESERSWSTLEEANLLRRACADTVQSSVLNCRRYGARATFFVMSDYLEGAPVMPCYIKDVGIRTARLEGHEEGLKSLCQDGNELQNHGARDRPYYWESEEEHWPLSKILVASEVLGLLLANAKDFQAMLLQSQARLDQFGKPCHRWYHIVTCHVLGMCLLPKRSQVPGSQGVDEFCYEASSARCT
eukprot:2542437-Amphidinium_carterae.2